MPFKRRTRRVQMRGIGIDGATLLDTDHYSSERRRDKAWLATLRRQLEPDPSAFHPIPDPEEDDWLWDRNTKDQV